MPRIAFHASSLILVHVFLLLFALHLHSSLEAYSENLCFFSFCLNVVPLSMVWCVALI
jgi:hypothetical protein